MAVKEVTDKDSKELNIQHAWFSDTFVMYSDDGSASDFVSMDMIARGFMGRLVTHKIPVRGAIACGDFYADRINQLYLGEALIEAYEYGEAQDWIGFLLCPSAIKRLNEVGLPADERLNYAYADIPFKATHANVVTKLPACILGSWDYINGENLCLSALREMKLKAPNDSVARKYDNSIKFIEANRRVPRPSNIPHILKSETRITQ